MKTMLIFSLAFVVSGCGGNFYLKGGLGWNGNATDSGTAWLGDDEIGGRLAGGWRRPVSENWNIDINATHHSQPWLQGEDPETTSEHVYFDLEYVF